MLLALGLLIPSRASALQTVVQSAACVNSSASNSLNCSLAGVTTKNGLFAWVVMSSAGTPTVSDDKSNSWTCPGVNGSFSADACIANNVTGGSVTFTASAGANVLGIVIQELNQTLTYDTISAGCIGRGCSDSITTAHANEFISAVTFDNGALGAISSDPGTLTLSGYTFGAHNWASTSGSGTNGFSIQGNYQWATTATSYGATWQNAVGSWESVLAAFQATTVVTAPMPPVVF